MRISTATSVPLQIMSLLYLVFMMAGVAFWRSSGTNIPRDGCSLLPVRVACLSQALLCVSANVLVWPVFFWMQVCSSKLVEHNLCLAPNLNLSMTTMHCKDKVVCADWVVSFNTVVWAPYDERTTGLDGQHGKQNNRKSVAMAA